jgi:hypothetical protein
MDKPAQTHVDEVDSTSMRISFNIIVLTVITKQDGAQAIKLIIG